MDDSLVRQIWKALSCEKVAVRLPTIAERNRLIDLFWNDPELRNYIPNYVSHNTFIMSRLWVKCLKEKGIKFALEQVTGPSGLPKNELEKLKKELGLR